MWKLPNIAKNLSRAKYSMKAQNIFTKFPPSNWKKNAMLDLSSKCKA
uniref:Uncharacterized protein n=1 Tax=Rhizophora mucronata TaxID=61149 RepID=A0A2P2ITS1_RHIMU